MRRLALKALAAIAAMIAVTAVALVVLARRSLPLLDGAVTLHGISAPIEIVRDADAIPHIFASTKHDALFGLGYVHAQDRLWQMEFQRRIGHGRLAEIFGAVAVPQDRFLRTVGFGRAARAAWARMPAAAQAQVNAYLAGVNAFIETHRGSALPPEFTLLRFQPEPFTGPDVVVWVKMMAWDLSANYSFELLRHDLLARVGPERAAELMPPYPAHGLSILERKSATTEDTDTNGDHGTPTYKSEAVSSVKSNPSSVTSVLELFENAMSQGPPAVRDFLQSNQREGLGSNNWVVDGSMSSSGKPLLANDPHLGTRLPSTWYLAHMSAGDFDVIGATLPGTPAVALGRNKFIAWGATNVAADVQDVYREHIDPTGRFAEFRGVNEPLTMTTETIAVKGAPPVRIDVRSTRHGPLVSDAINAINAATPAARRPPVVEPLALRWTALDSDDSTLESFLDLNEARSWDEFAAALRRFVVPSQNFVYADVNGHIGYYAPGRIPIRAHGDGAAPADGWTGENEWIGSIPFDALPHTADPSSHFIVTANNRPVSEGYPYLLGLEWAEPYRAQRVVDRLRERRTFSPADFAAIQADTISLHARALLPALVAHARPTDARDQEALARVRSWNFDARPESAAAAVFEAWFLRLAPTLVGDELGPIVTDLYQSRFTFVARFVSNTLASNDSPWCDDVTTTARKETCDDAVTTALHEGMIDLTRRLGGDMSRWRWSAVHSAVFPHQGLDAVALLRPLISRSVPNGGDWSTVNVGTVSTDHPFEQRSVAGYRQIIDLSPANDSRFIIDIGESGHPLSNHYDDFLVDWQAVRHRKMRMARGDVENGAIGHLRLETQKSR
jgi:penicillin G amidase